MRGGPQGRQQDGVGLSGTLARVDEDRPLFGRTFVSAVWLAREAELTVVMLGPARSAAIVTLERMRNPDR